VNISNTQDKHSVRSPGWIAAAGSVGKSSGPAFFFDADFAGATGLAPFLAAARFTALLTAAGLETSDFAAALFAVFFATTRFGDDFDFFEAAFFAAFFTFFLIATTGS
jgi:hypothetical protein